MTVIDRRVVEMGFDNKQFESGVQTSLKTVDSLKKGLNFDESAKSLTNLAAVGRSFSLAGIADGVQNISSKFSAMGVVGFTVLQNLTNMVIDFGKKTLGAVLGIDQMRTGFSSYEVKINAVRTVMSGTGETMDQVTQSLDELNRYSDRTIYSFQDMTENISKFTNAGLSSKAAATAIQGISNVAAISGANTQEAARAMYNFGQAMQQGSVRLMDWKSIENANMATIGFKTQLIQTAVAMGTLTVAADGTYKTLKGEVLSATKNFNGSLEQMWLTTDVLSKTLADYASQETEIGKAANAAAQDVKTFSQMMDTIKDSVKTGWTKTWGILVGDLTEATTLFTLLNNTIGGFLSESSTARNDLLKGWKDLGGRDVLFASLQSALDSLLKIMKPIREAFAKWFPSLNANQLMVFTYWLQRLVEKFKITDDTASKIFRTFSGLFGILHLVKMGITGLVNGLLKFIGVVVPSGGSILDFTANIGDWLIRLRNAIIYTDIFTNAFEKIKQFVINAKKAIQDFIAVVAPVLGPIFSKIGGFFSKLFGDVDITSFSTFGATIGTILTKIGGYFAPVKKSFDDFARFIGPVFTRIKDFFIKFFEGIKTTEISGRFEPLMGLFKTVGQVCLWIWQVLVKVAPILAKFGSLVGEQLGKLGGAILDSLNNINYNNIFDGLNGGLIAALLIAIKKFVTQGSGVFSGISGILDGVGNSLATWQKNVQAKTLMTIAIAIGILAVSLIGLSLVDSTKLTFALTSVSLMFTELIGSMALFSKIPGGGGLASAAASLVAISASVLILSGAIAILANLDPEAMSQGLIGISVTLTELALFLKVTDLSGMGATKSVGLVVLAGALIVLSEAVKKFGDLDPEALKQGLIAVGAVLTELALFVNLTANSANVLATAVSLTIIGAAMLIFAEAIRQMGSMSWEEIGKGLTTMGAALGIVTVAVTLMPKDMIITGAGLVIVAAALVILAQALGTMGNMSWESIAKSLVTLTGSLLILALAMYAMEAALPGAAAMLVVAPALVIMAGALTTMGGMSWDEIGRGLTVMAGALLILALALNAMTSTIPGAVAILIVSGALAILAPVLKTLGSMSLEEIALALIAIAGVFVILGIAGYALGPVIPVILGLAGSIALFGVACLAIGVGVLAFSMGLTALAAAGAGAGAAIVIIVMSIISLVPAIIKALGEAILLLGKMIIDIAPVLVTAIGVVLVSLIAGIVAVIPPLVDAILLIITTILQGLAESLPDIIQAGYDIIIAFMKGISDNIEEIVTVAYDIVIHFMDAVAVKLPEVIDSAFELIVAFINGLADGIDENMPAINDAVGNLVNAIVNGFCSGILNSVELAKSAITNFGQATLDALKSLLGIASPSKVTKKYGRDTTKGYTDGILENADSVIYAAKELKKNVVSGLSGAISQVSNALDGNMNFYPTIQPVVDLKNIIAGGKEVDSLFGNRNLIINGVATKLGEIAGEMPSPKNVEGQINQPTQNQSVSFTQNNYSPTALSRIEIYRQTRNQLKLIKGLVTNT